MSKPTVLVLVGLPGCGKSTFAKQWLAEDADARVRVNYDDLRLGMFGEHWAWNRKDEESMKAAARSITERALTAGLSVVIDNTNLSPRVRAGWHQLAARYGAEYAEQNFDTSIDECIHRDRQRPVSQRVGQAVIDGMALHYELLGWDVKPIVIVDIDGTIANDNGRLRHLTPPCPSCEYVHPPITKAGEACGGMISDSGEQRFRKDWGAYFAAVGSDIPIPPMVKLLERLSDHLIVLISGRPVSNGTTPVGIITEDWLLANKIYFDRLFLKTDNFHQKSPDFKRGILEQMPKERVAYVFDDDLSCLAMYRSQLPDAWVMGVGR